MVTVTAETHPSLWNAFKLIDHDNGVGHYQRIFNKQSPDFVECDFTQEQLDIANAALVGLSDWDFETFVIGEETDQEVVKLSVPGLDIASLILNKYFDTL